MCNQAAFIAYWVFGIGVAGAVMLIASQRIRAKWPGADEHRIRTLMMIPPGFAAMLLGGLLWLHGAQQTSAAVCEDQEPAPAMDYRAAGDAILQSMSKADFTDLEDPSSDRRGDSSSP